MILLIWISKINFKYKYMKKTVFKCKRDDFTISGTEYRNENNNGIPVIISHGFLANQKRLKPYAKHLADKGYIVLPLIFAAVDL